MDHLQRIENGFENVEQIRKKLLVAKKVQLHTGMEGFNSPDAFGIYRQEGGDALGVVGSVFEPMDLGVFLDTVTQSLINCGDGFDLSKLQYKEYNDGKKVAFEIESNKFEVESPVVGDVFQSKLRFSTGFDGLTKVTLGFSTLRLFCENGARGWRQEKGLSFKNTIGNQAKALLFCDQIADCIADIQNYKDGLELLAKTPVTQKQIDEFLTKVTGYDMKEYKDFKTKRRNIIDRINESVAIEQQQLGMSLYTLLNGITRYTTHDLAGGSVDNVMYGGAERMNRIAHQEAFAMVGLN